MPAPLAEIFKSISASAPTDRIIGPEPVVACTISIQFTASSPPDVKLRIIFPSSSISNVLASKLAPSCGVVSSTIF